MISALYLGSSAPPRIADGGSGANSVTWIPERDLARGLRWLSVRAVDLVVVDARAATGLPEHEVHEALERLFPRHASHGLASRNRALVLVDGDRGGQRISYACGLRRLPPPLVDPDDQELRARLDASRRATAPSRIALCLAGGGIEGLLYEVGVLRALARCLPERRLCDLDLFLGISAGSFLSALLANGVTPDEIVDGLRNGNARVHRITRSDLFDPAVGEYVARAAGLGRDLVGLGSARNPISALYRALPSGMFAGSRLRRYFERVFTSPGMSDRFDALPRPLFIGATDQDTSEAVLFGEPGRTDVPIHRAVRASCSLAPFYLPENIDGRWYIDGAFTRTTNMREAVRKGATLCILVDPLVPIYSPQAGYVVARGGLFAAMQGLKALINGRFDKAAGTIAEMYPEVAFHIFRPEGEEMRILSGSPMKFLYREDIEALAYESTLREIRARMTRLRHDFGRHGVVFGEPTASAARDPWTEGALSPA